MVLSSENYQQKPPRRSFRSFASPEWFAPLADVVSYCALLLVAVVLWDQVEVAFNLRCGPQTAFDRVNSFVSCGAEATAVTSSGGTVGGDYDDGDDEAPGGGAVVSEAARRALQDSTVMRANDRRIELHRTIEAQVGVGSVSADDAQSDEQSMDALLQMLSTRGVLRKRMAARADSEAANSDNEDGDEPPADPRHLPIGEWGVPDTNSLRSVRVMIVGDAATCGLAKDMLPKFPSGANSFRKVLWRLLRENSATSNVSFVGPFRQSHLGPSPSADFAPHHAARYAMTLGEFDTQHARQWAADYRPDIVLMLLGANDLGQQHLAQHIAGADSSSGTTGSSSEAIFKILAHARSAVAKMLANTPSSTIVLVSTLLPTTHPFGHLVPAFNLALESMLLRTPHGHKAAGAASLHAREVLIEDSELFDQANALKVLRMTSTDRRAHLKTLYEQREATSDSPIVVPGAIRGMRFRRVFVVNGGTGLDAKKHLLDGIMPNAVGEEIVAANFFMAVQDAIALHRRIVADKLTTLREAAKTVLWGLDQDSAANKAKQPPAVSANGDEDRIPSSPKPLQQAAILPPWVAAVAFAGISVMITAVLYTKMSLRRASETQGRRRVAAAAVHRSSRSSRRASADASRVPSRSPKPRTEKTPQPLRH